MPHRHRRHRQGTETRGHLDRGPVADPGPDTGGGRQVSGGAGGHTTVVLLAAGQGRRMGGPKALMNLSGRAWWAVQNDRLAGRRAVWVASAEVRPALVGVVSVVAASTDPMFESVRVGVRHALEDAECRGVFILPVDVPVPGAVVFAALEAAAADGPALPAHRGVRGHPAFLPRDWATDHILNAPLEPPPRLDALMKPSETIVDVDDPSVCVNLNTPADRARFEAGAGTPAPASPDLEAFLVDRDVPCPSCHYNLRGVAVERCPECGEPIALGIVGTRARSALGFVLLALIWVLLASGMNGARQGYLAYEQGRAAAQPRGRVMMFSSSSSFTVGGTTTSTTTRLNPDGSTTTTKTLPSGQTVTTTTGGNPGTTKPPPTFLWSGIQFDVWTQLGWWCGLGLFAALALGVLSVLRIRGRTLQRTGTRVLVGWSATLFVLYGGYHAVNFVREVLKW
ncbi:MAG: nucleotidyltransferase family protein [Phycisphaerales bacterium]